MKFHFFSSSHVLASLLFISCCLPVFHSAYVDSLGRVPVGNSLSHRARNSSPHQGDKVSNAVVEPTRDAARSNVHAEKQSDHRKATPSSLMLKLVILLFNIFVPHLPLALIHFFILFVVRGTSEFRDACLSSAVLYIASVINGFVYNVVWEGKLSQWPRVFRPYGNGSKLCSWYFSLIDLRQLMLFEFATTEFLDVAYWPLPLLVLNIASWYIAPLFPLFIRLPLSIVHACFVSALFLSKVRKVVDNEGKRIFLVDELFGKIVGKAAILDNAENGQYFSPHCVNNGYGSILNIFFGDIHVFLKKELDVFSLNSWETWVTLYNIFWPWIYPIQLIFNCRGEGKLLSNYYWSVRLKSDLSFITSAKHYIFSAFKAKKKPKKGDPQDAKGAKGIEPVRNPASGQPTKGK